MIQRHQRIVFWCLILCVIGMGILLAVERQRGRDRIAALAADQTPLDAPTATTEAVTLDLANDADGTISVTTRQIALPEEVNARARALIDHLIAEYALPGSPHPLPPGSAVAEVFLLPLPVVGYAADTSTAASSDSGSTSTLPVGSSDLNASGAKQPGGELAVIDLHSTFVNQHPSGVEVETLTLRSILGTLHANVPQIEQVRFLVDGQARETLAGHADLLRTYPASDTTSRTNSVRDTNEGQLN
jgi:hypothetical protein